MSVIMHIGDFLINFTGYIVIYFNFSVVVFFYAQKKKTKWWPMCEKIWFTIAEKRYSVFGLCAVYFSMNSINQNYKITLLLLIY